MVPLTNISFENIKSAVDYLSTHHVIWEAVGKAIGYIVRESMKTPMPVEWTETVGKALEHANTLIK